MVDTAGIVGAGEAAGVGWKPDAAAGEVLVGFWPWASPDSGERIWVTGMAVGWALGLLGWSLESSFKKRATLDGCTNMQRPVKHLKDIS